MDKIRNAAESCLEEIIAIRRDIHRHPEIGRAEVRTSELIRSKLAEYGVEEISSPVPTAVVALIRGTKGPGKCVALRADIDALPVEEQTGLPYASEIPHMMHACGHDMHTAMLLGVAKILCGMRDQFPGVVKLIFQHSEDTLPGGAKELVEVGVVQDVDAIFGLHVMPDGDRVGQVALYTGPVTTSVDLYDVTVSGKGGHGSAPQTTTDALLTACQMVVLLQQIVARRVDPLDTAIVSMGSIHSGDAPNVIPSVATFGGITRAYRDSVREIINRQFFDIAKGMESISGCKVDIHHYEGYPTTVNDKDLIDCARTAVCAALGGDAVVELDGPLAFSEDFSYYGKLGGVPSAYLLLYAGHEGDLVSLHNPKCAMKEEAMPAGMTAMAATALAYLNQ